MVSALVKQHERDAWHAEMMGNKHFNFTQASKLKYRWSDSMRTMLAAAPLFEARAGTLRTLEYLSSFNPAIMCTQRRVRGKDSETVEHIVKL
ncbi:hypothetical protein HPB50_029372 [Hyalomma asiaticum]|nr:hypothetical protein HPB50_029372 [Hyalomma asiaticum]